MTLAAFTNTNFEHFVNRMGNKWHLKVSVTPTEMKFDFVKDGSKDVYPAAVVQLRGRHEVLQAIAIAKEVKKNG